jgi:transformation/transcription domain-associated protein
MLPSLTPKTPNIINKDTVPFRYTPNIQTFIGEVGLEGLFSCAIMAIARCLSEPEVTPPPPPPFPGEIRRFVFWC